MWFLNRGLPSIPKALVGDGGRRRSPRFGVRNIEMLEDRALMSHAVHQAMAHNSHPMPHRQTRFVQTNLVSNLMTVSAVTIDPKLVNPWGLAASSTSPWWVSDNGSGFSTLYNGAGTKQGLEVAIAPPTGSPAGTLATPTGIVFNGNNEFLVGPSAPAMFIFATEDGTISGWNPTVDRTHTILEVDNSTQMNANGSTGAVYKGLAMANMSGSDFLYATNFRSGKVDVFDSSFHQVTLASGAFTDRHIPSGYAPFGIANITPPGSSKSFLVVTYAKQDADKHDDVAGVGHGFVDVFDTSGHLINRVASRGQLNSPWGIAVAPSNFGRFSGDLLIGNFGNGRINAFKFPAGHSHTFQFAGQLTKSNGRPITIDGLWSLAFGNGANAGPTNTLFFTAGLNHEANGLFGTLTTA